MSRSTPQGVLYLESALDPQMPLSITLALQ
jgi:hypothetical protein